MIDGVGRLKRLDDFTLADLESVALMLRGESVIDWHRLHVSSVAEAHELMLAQELSPDEPKDRDRMEQLKSDAISYLRRHFEFPIPKPIEQASPEELLMVASTKGHRQVCACSVLKAMHIIHHLDGRELLFTLPLSDQEVFHLVEEKVYRVIGGMLSAGFPITEFVGGRKNKDSLYTKLLSKQDTIAAAIYDKLRFRIVTRSQRDLLPVLLYLSHRLFPFNYVIPGESVNTIFHFKSYCEKNPHLAGMLGEMQTPLGDDLNPGDNRFSADSYRTIHFVVDLPVRLPRETLDLAPVQARGLGSIVYVLCEFQLIDQDTEAANELGEASHARYKERQKGAVMRRLKIGMRELYTPPGASPPKKADEPEQ
jgi:uncharacterized protein (TIGR04552 family)